MVRKDEWHTANTKKNAPANLAGTLWLLRPPTISLCLETSNDHMSSPRRFFTWQSCTTGGVELFQYFGCFCARAINTNNATAVKGPSIGGVPSLKRSCTWYPFLFSNTWLITTSVTTRPSRDSRWSSDDLNKLAWKRTNISFCNPPRPTCTRNYLLRSTVNIYGSRQQLHTRLCGRVDA